jgi:uncharacterized protein (DUF305 family)
MTPQHRTALRMAAAEARDGGIPKVRELAGQMATELQTQLQQMASWTRAWAKSEFPSFGGFRRVSQPSPESTFIPVLGSGTCGS